MRSAAVAFALLVPSVAPGAQIAWDAPLLVPPSPQPGLGVYLIEAARGDLGGLVTWRGAGPASNVGLRGGLAETRTFAGEDEVALFLGIDVSGAIESELPVDFAWVTGLGASADGDFGLAIPGGVAAGVTLAAGRFGVRPYGIPRLTLEFFEERPLQDDVNLDLSFDWGVDVMLDRITVRFGATIGDREALAAGVLF